MPKPTAAHSDLDVPRGRGAPLPTLRLRGPEDLVHAVPYLIGFHPHDSLVLVGLDGPQLIVTARLDLADACDTGALEHTVAAIHRGGAEELVCLVVTASTRDGSAAAWEPELAAVLRAADDVGCAVLDVLLVGDNRWWSLLCDDAGCCPADGTALESPEHTEVAATATFAGLVALPDRTALAARLQPRPLPERRQLLPALTASAAPSESARRSVKRALFAAARAAAAPTAAERVRLGAALRDIAVRDAVWLAVDDGRLDGRTLWLDLATHLPAPYDAAPLFLFGWASWRHGNGALAGMAAERAIESDPAYSAADLLLAAVRGGVDPRQLPKLRSRRSA